MCVYSTPFPGAMVFLPLRLHPVFVLGIALTHVQDIALGLAELKIRMGPPLKPVQVPLDSIPSLQCVDCPTRFAAEV